MKTHILLLPALALAAAALPGANTKTDRTINATAAFNRLKTLAGEWEGNTDMGKVHLSYEVIAAGTSLVEREAGEKMPTMLTVYHLDGGRLLLSHYCMAGNQPRMQAQSYNPEGGELQFKFLDATNLTPGAGHMHNATFRFVDNDHLATEWQFYENGRPKMTENTQFTRVR